ncbi:hypothetical protein [Nocardioides sp. zg-1230]|uniref:hypothetical protein n=1 Tax=Nocardioides sp. zg-1230 TaxID=2736601 RepID=UPI00155222DD|nr:hypothetical protein [Nocardioides sp. zg-1230]NPC43506.1 hypothetical protein [Nocardioides sp. zg-1230]
MDGVGRADPVDVLRPGIRPWRRTTSTQPDPMSYAATLVAVDPTLAAYDIPGR